MDSNMVAGNISRLRKQKGLTQKDLAERLNITDKAVSKWERGAGYPEITIVPELAKVLGVSIDELLGGEEDVSGSASAEPADPPGDLHLPTPKELATHLKKSAYSAVISKIHLPAVKRERKQKTRTFHAPFSHLTGRQQAVIWMTLTFLTGMFASLIVNLAVSGGNLVPDMEHMWCLVVVASCMLAWGVAAPLILLEKYRYLVSMAALSVLILPFLMLMNWLSPVSGWFTPLALPVSVMSLGVLWLFALLCTFTRISWWFLGALLLFISPVFNYVINNRLLPAMDGIEVLPFYWDISSMLNLLACVILGLILCVIGIVTRRKKEQYS